MRLRQTDEYPKRDLTPEHTKRGSDHSNDGPTHPDVLAAYAHVDSVLDTSDFDGVYAWHGWALREAYLAGASHGAAAERERMAIAWDGCVHEAPGGDVDVGASIRAGHLVSVRDAL